MTTYVDPQTGHNPASGGVAPSTWGDTVRNSMEHLATRHGVRCRRTTTLSVPNATPTVIPLDAEDIDTDGYHSTSVNTSRFTIPSNLAGVYTGEAYVRIDGALSIPYVLILKNGTPIRRMYPVSPGAAFQSFVVPFTTWLDVADYIEVAVFHQHGSSQNITAITTATTTDPLVPLLEMWLVGGVHT